MGIDKACADLCTCVGQVRTPEMWVRLTFGCHCMQSYVHMSLTLKCQLVAAIQAACITFLCVKFHANVFVHSFSLFNCCV